MPGRKSKPEAGGAVTFNFTRNWTAVVFFGLLGGLHLSMAITSLMAYRWESYMSLTFGTFFVTIAACCAMVRHRVIVRPAARQIVVRTGMGRAAVERRTPFKAVSCVRVMILGRDPRESAVSIVCDTDEIELPPTRTPRQQALLLSMVMDVRLVKVYGDGPPPEPAERIAKLFRNEDAV